MRAGFLVVCLILGFCQFPQAQGRMAVGGAMELAVPLGNFGDNANTGYGFTGRFQYEYNESLMLLGTVGYLAWDGPEIPSSILRTNISFDYSAFPIKVGAKYILSKSSTRFYLMADGGVQIFRVKASSIVESDPLFEDLRSSFYTASSTRIKLTFAPGVGIEKALGERTILDISARFEMVQNLQYFGVRAGLNLVLK